MKCRTCFATMYRYKWFFDFESLLIDILPFPRWRVRVDYLSRQIKMVHDT